MPKTTDGRTPEDMLLDQALALLVRLINRWLDQQSEKPEE